MYGVTPFLLRPFQAARVSRHHTTRCQQFSSLRATTSAVPEESVPVSPPGNESAIVRFRKLSEERSCRQLLNVVQSVFARPSPQCTSAVRDCGGIEKGDQKNYHTGSPIIMGVCKKQGP